MNSDGKILFMLGELTEAVKTLKVSVSDLSKQVDTLNKYRWKMIGKAGIIMLLVGGCFEIVVQVVLPHILKIG